LQLTTNSGSPLVDFFLCSPFFDVLPFGPRRPVSAFKEIRNLAFPNFGNVISSLNFLVWVLIDNPKWISTREISSLKNITRGCDKINIVADWVADDGISITLFTENWVMKIGIVSGLFRSLSPNTLESTKIETIDQTITIIVKLLTDVPVSRCRS